jgi:hypothetical protein
MVHMNSDHIAVETSCYSDTVDISQISRAILRQMINYYGEVIKSNKDILYTWIVKRRRVSEDMREQMKADRKEKKRLAKFVKNPPAWAVRKTPGPSGWGEPEVSSSNDSYGWNNINNNSSGLNISISSNFQKKDANNTVEYGGGGSGKVANTTSTMLSFASQQYMRGETSHLLVSVFKFSLRKVKFPSNSFKSVIININNPMANMTEEVVQIFKRIAEQIYWFFQSVPVVICYNPPQQDIDKLKESVRQKLLSNRQKNNGEGAGVATDYSLKRPKIQDRLSYNEDDVRIYHSAGNISNDLHYSVIDRRKGGQEERKQVCVSSKHKIYDDLEDEIEFGCRMDGIMDIDKFRFIFEDFSQATSLTSGGARWISFDLERQTPAYYLAPFMSVVDDSLMDATAEENHVYEHMLNDSFSEESEDDDCW